MITLELTLVFRLLLAIATCYRLARMIATDDGPGFIFKQLQYWVKDKEYLEAKEAGALTAKGEIEDRWYGKWHNLAEGLTCPYCAGVWVSLPLFIFVIYPTTISDLFLLLMAINGGQAFLQSLDKK